MKTVTLRPLIAVVACSLIPPVFSETAIVTTSQPVVLQTLNTNETSYFLPASSVINTASGDGIVGDNSRNWRLLIEGVVSAAVTGIRLSSLNDAGVIINISGALTGRSGTAIELNSANSLITLNSGAVVSGDILSNGANNRLVLNGSGSTSGNFTGTKGFTSFDVNASSLANGGQYWATSGNILLGGNSLSSGRINSGLLVTTGTVSASNSNAGITISPGAFLQIGDGGTTGEIDVPVLNQGTLTFFRSSAPLTITTEVSGNGIFFLRGTGVNGQSSYVIKANGNDFTGNVIVGNGARLQATGSNPTPQAHIIVNDGGTLWLGSSADYATPLFLQGDGWHENNGKQFGALRLDSNAVQSGPVTLLGNTQITAVFEGYYGTVSGDITDNSQGYVLEKTGGGQITLSGNNNYTGGTVISEGTLAVSKDENLGASATPLTLAGGSTLLMNTPFVSQRPLIFGNGAGNLAASSANIFAGDISGGGQAVIRQGSVILAGNDSHSGGTTINDGAQLQIGTDAVNAGATGTLKGSVINNGALVFDRAGTSTYDGVLSGTGTLIQQGSGNVMLTGAGSDQGNVEVTGGTLAFAQAGTFISNGNVVTADGATTAVAAGAVVQAGGQVQQNALASLELSANLTQPAIVAPRILLDGALILSGALSSASSAIGKTLTALHSSVASGISGDFTSLGFSHPADYLLVSGTKTNNNTDYVLGFGLRWLAGPAAGNGTFTLINAADSFSVDVPLSDQTGPFESGWDGKTLTKSGEGTLILSQQNTYSGATQINGGTLQTSVANAFATSSAVSIAAGGTLSLNNADQHATNLSGAGNGELGNAALTVVSQAATEFSGVISGTGSVIKRGAQDFTLSGNNTYSGGTQINDGTLIATTGNALGTGNIVNASQLTLDFSVNSLMRNPLSGSGILLKKGNGRATLTATGSLIGEVNNQQGTLLFATRDRFSTTGNMVTDAGATTATGPRSSLNVGGLFDVRGTLSLLVGGIEPVVTAAQIALGATSRLNIAGITTQESASDVQRAENRYQVLKAATPGALSGGFETLSIGGATSPVDYATVTGFTDALSQRYDVGIRLNWYAQHSDTPEVATGAFTLAKPGEEFELETALADQNANLLTGWDGKTLTKAGDGTLILSRQNLYTGATLINGGTLQTGITDAFSRSSGVGIAAGATLALNDFDQHISLLSGAGNISLGAATLTLSNATDNTFSGIISGQGVLTKSGSGTLFLSENTPYTGVTTVSEGSLIIGSETRSASLASSQVNIASGAILGGYGSTAGSINNQGTLVVADAVAAYSGGSPGDFTVGGDLINSGNLVMASAFPASTLTVKGNYTGNNGLLTLSTVLAGDESATDKLVILGDSSGTTRVQINNAGGSGAATVNGIALITVAGQSDGVFTQENRVVAGAYDYFLQKNASNGNWYLLSQTPAPPAPVPPEPAPEPDPAPRIVRPEAGSYLANLAAARTLFTQRLSDRAGRAEHSTLWLRQTGAHTDFYDGSGQLKTTTNRYVVQGGGEVLSGQFGSQDALGIGVMVGYGNAQSNTDASRSRYSAQGKVDGYSSGVYATWYQNAKTQEGVYADSWVQYSWLKGNVNGEQLPSENYDIRGFSGSVESGYRLPVYRGENGDVFITPQAQFIWEGLSADNHTESNGTRVRSTGDNNVMSRLGVRISRDGVASQDRASGKLFTPYAEVNWLHNTDSTGVTLDGEGAEQAGTANIGEVKLGVEGKLTSRLNVWTNVAQQVGGDGYNNVSGLVGLNYQF